MLFQAGCTTLDRYEGHSNVLKKYCKAVLRDAGYKKPFPKKGMANCLSQYFTEKDNSKFRELAGIAVYMLSAWLFIDLLFPGPSIFPITAPSD